MLNNLIFALFRTDARTDIEPQTATPDESNGSISPQTKASKYADDIESLTEWFGDLSKGQHISVTLQEMLDICPRSRRRVEAYMGLTSYLKKELDVTLTIKSNRSNEK